jgi:YebC/PmpR family DNA-binding regulatory protein
MSGHSHWKTIKRGKEIEDKKKSKIFSKMSRVITLAARDGRDSPALRIAIEKARQYNMPKDSIEKAIATGTGEIKSADESFLMEAIGPHGSAIIIEGITDNKNRSLNEIKQIVQKYGGKMGSVLWMFDRRGTIVVKNGDELQAIEAGAEDMEKDEDMLIVFTKPENLEAVKSKLDNVESAFLEWAPKETISANVSNIVEALEDHDDVQDVYTNVS